MMMIGYKLHVMTQATYFEDWANLLNGVYVVKTYSELHDGSCSISVVLHNLTGKPVHLAAGQAVARVVAANAIPDTTPSPEFLQKLDELEPLWDPPKKLTVEERQKLLLKILRKEGRLDKLKKWPPESALRFERERSQNTVLLASTQAVYKAPHSTVREQKKQKNKQSSSSRTATEIS